MTTSNLAKGDIVRCVHLGPHFGKGGGRGVSDGTIWVPFERAMVVSCKLSMATIALSLTIRTQFTIKFSDA